MAAARRAGERAWEIYDLLVLRRPALSLAVLGAISLALGWFIKDFRIDASGDALVLEHDEDVRYYRAMADRYGSGEFVIITYSPPEELFSAPALDRLKRLRDELKTLPRVSSVVTILDVPLLKNPPGTLKELKDNIKTLEHPKASLKYAVEEFRKSPIYQNLLVGEDMRSSAIQVNFKVDAEDKALVSRRSNLREKRYRKEITLPEEAELAELEEKYRLFKDRVAQVRSSDIAALRKILVRYGNEARFFLGGVPMIIQDITAYIRSDILLFGIAMLGFVMVTLYLIYRHIRWVVLPVICCLLAVFVMMGGMGLTHWDVTVVSSNFASLQIILTMSFAIHIVSHYREMVWMKPQATNHELVMHSARDTFIPCLYTNLAAIAGFQSLIFCDIVPVVQFGWIMTLGMIVSMIIVYWLLPAAIMLLPRPQPKEEDEWGAPLTFAFARISDKYRSMVYVVSAAVTLLTVVGIYRLEVENSFIDYFRKSTEIYKGMKFIDDNLGGTTPLDVIVKLGSAKKEAPAAKPADPGEEDDDFAEFEDKASGDKSRYWFTSDRLTAVEKVHDYLDGLPETGKVLSLATLYKTALDLNQGKRFDDFGLALLYNTGSESVKSVLVDPYVNLDSDEARITTRIKDSMPSIRRDALIKRIRADLSSKLGLEPENVRVSGLMVLYNNMLQSLFSSQIKTAGSSIVTLYVMFLVLFRSFRIAFVALAPQTIACLSVLGIMGLAGIPLDIMTITVVSIAMGIGVEDAIHYVYRFQEEIEKDHNYERALYHCHLTVGNAIFYTSLAVTAGFSILAFSNFVPTVMFGLLTGVAMVAAGVSAQTLLPALIVLTKPFGKGKMLSDRHYG